MLENDGKVQFEKIEERLGTIITVPKKIQCKFWEFPEILELGKVEATARGLTTQQWYRWIGWRQLYKLGKIHVEIDEYKPRICSDEELEIKTKVFDPRCLIKSSRLLHIGSDLVTAILIPYEKNT
jgi:hypothetical protein